MERPVIPFFPDKNNPSQEFEPHSSSVRVQKKPETSEYHDQVPPQPKFSPLNQKLDNFPNQTQYGAAPFRNQFVNHKRSTTANPRRRIIQRIQPIVFVNEVSNTFKNREEPYVIFRKRKKKDWYLINSRFLGIAVQNLSNNLLLNIVSIFCIIFRFWD